MTNPDYELIAEMLQDYREKTPARSSRYSSFDVTDQIYALRAAANAQPSAADGGVREALVPVKFGIPAEAWEAAAFAFGGPATGDDEPYMDCTAWIGYIEQDDGSKVHGLHIACDECLEEGSITLAEFPDTAIARHPGARVPYSIDDDPDGIRERAASAITGALAFGAQGSNVPPEGHWLAPFWEMAHAELTTLAAPEGMAQSEPLEYWLYTTTDVQLRDLFDSRPIIAERLRALLTAAQQEGAT